MNNIESNFVPYQIALDMKELGFDEPCFKVYDNMGFLQEESVMNTCEIECDCILERYLAPLYQQAFKFVLTIIENDPKLEYKFMDRFFLDFSSEGFQMDDRELSTTYESDEETLANITNFIILNK
jgi:hypothetical protein